MFRFSNVASKQGLLTAPPPPKNRSTQTREAHMTNSDSDQDSCPSYECRQAAAAKRLAAKVEEAKKSKSSNKPDKPQEPETPDKLQEPKKQDKPQEAKKPAKPQESKKAEKPQSPLPKQPTAQLLEVPVLPKKSKKPSTTPPAEDGGGHCPSHEHQPSNTDQKHELKDLVELARLKADDFLHSDNEHPMNECLQSDEGVSVVKPKKSRLFNRSHKPKKSKQSKEAEQADTRQDTKKGVPPISTESKKSKEPKTSSKAKRSETTGKTVHTELETLRCEDSDHDSPVDAKTPKNLETPDKKKDKKPRSQRSKGSMRSNFAEETPSQQCDDSEHDPPLLTPRPAKPEKARSTRQIKRPDKEKVPDYKEWLQTSQPPKAQEEPKLSKKDAKKKAKQLKESRNAKDKDGKPRGRGLFRSRDKTEKTPAPKDEQACPDTEHDQSSIPTETIRKGKNGNNDQTKISKASQKLQDTSPAAPGGKSHTIDDCAGVPNTDGPSSRKQSVTALRDAESEGIKAKTIIRIAKTLKPSPDKAFPRGLQLLAKNTDTLLGGFPYVKELAAFDIRKSDWDSFCKKLTEPLAKKGIAYAIESVLDVCADYDVNFFRPRGFMMRLDMPGEEKYGLELLDIYHIPTTRSNHTDNLTALPSSTREYTGIIKHKQHKPSRTNAKRHLANIRKKAFCSTRIMLDPIIVLNDFELASERGWARWIVACKEAQQLAKKTPIVKDNKPLFGYFPVRYDRWPPSKHLYYERFRGTLRSSTIRVRVRPGGIYSSRRKASIKYLVPDHLSMTKDASAKSPVLPCDEVESVLPYVGQQPSR